MTGGKVKTDAQRVAAAKTPEQCEILAENALKKGNHQLAALARQRAIELRAEVYGARSEVERECYEAVHAYEEVLSSKASKRRRASRTWQMIKRLGILPAVEQLVTKRHESSGYTSLVEMGLQRFAFEAVVLRHPEHFSAEALAQSRTRLGETWGKT